MSAPPAPTPRSRGRRRWIGLGIVLGVALATTPWWIDDLARGLVVRILAGALDAEVTLDRLTLEAKDRVLLEGLTVSHPAGFPPVERLRVGRLKVEADLLSLVGGDARHLAVEDAEAFLVPGRWPASSDPSPLRYPRLDLGPTAVTIRSHRGSASLSVQAQLSDDGGGPRGTVRAEAPNLLLAPVFDLLAALDPDATGDRDPKDTDSEAPESEDPATPLAGWTGRLDQLDARVVLGESFEEAEVTFDQLVAEGSTEESLVLEGVSLGLAPEEALGQSSPAPQRVTVSAHRLAAEATGVELRAEGLTGTAQLVGDPLPNRVEGRTEILTLLRHDTSPPAAPSTPESPAASSAAPIQVDRPRLEFTRQITAEGAPEPSSGPTGWSGRLVTDRVRFPGGEDAPGQQLETAQVDWVVTPLASDGAPEGPLRIEATADLPGVDTIRFEAEVDLQGEIRSLGVEWQGLRLERFLPWFEPRLAGLEGPCHGAVALGPASLVADVQLPELGGTLATPSGPRSLPEELFPVRLEIESGRPGLDPALAGTVELGTALGRLEVGGRLDLGSGTPAPGAGASGASDRSPSPSIEGNWRWRGTPLEQLLPPWAGTLEVTAPVELAGELEAHGSLAGTLAEPIVRARIDGTRLRVSSPSTDEDPGIEHPELTDGTLHVELTWGPEELLRCESLELDGSLVVPGFEPLPSSLRAAARWARARGESEKDVLAVDSFTLDLAGARLAGSVIGSPSASAADWSGTVELEAFDLATLLERSETPPLAGFELRGELTASLAIAPRDGGLTVVGPWSAKGLGFQSDDGARVLEGLAGSGQLDGHWHPTDGWRAETRVEASGFLLLWDTLFADFSTTAPVLEALAEGKAGNLHLATVEMEVTPDTRLGLAFDASDSGGELPWILGVEALDLEALHRDLLLPGLGADRVGEELSGQLLGSWRGNFESTDSWRLLGDLAVDELSWRRGEQRVAGLTVELPFDLTWREGRASGQRQTGWLTFETMASGPFVLPSVDTLLWIEGDALGLEASLELPLYGGTVRIERLTLDELLGAAPALVAGLDLEALDLAAIAQAYDFLPLEGTLEGKLPSLRLADTEQGSVLTVDGGGEMRLFDGVVRVHGITGRDLLSPFPRITLSADLEALDLGQFTRKIDFGEMTGVLEGTIRDCELFRGVPVTCRAHLETVERPGISRTVDVKAVNNLTILGTGQGNLFDRGLRRFFKRFTYDKLLLDLELANDVLLLRGQPVRGDREVFLSGRLPFPIEVVNAQPGRTVSFETMRRRLESLDFEGVTTSP